MNRFPLVAVAVTLVLLGAAPAAVQLTPIFPNHQRGSSDPDAERAYALCPPDGGPGFEVVGPVQAVLATTSAASRTISAPRVTS